MSTQFFWQERGRGSSGDEDGSAEGKAGVEQNEEDEEEGFDLEAIAWFESWSKGTLLPKGACVIVQRAGEVVFVPAGWWHVVLNCSASTTALSHSIGLRRDFAKTWPSLVEEDPEMALFWLQQVLKEEAYCDGLPNWILEWGKGRGNSK